MRINLSSVQVVPFGSQVEFPSGTLKDYHSPPLVRLKETTVNPHYGFLRVVDNSHSLPTNKAAYAGVAMEAPQPAEGKIAYHLRGTAMCSNANAVIALAIGITDNALTDAAAGQVMEHYSIVQMSKSTMDIDRVIAVDSDSIIVDADQVIVCLGAFNPTNSTINSVKFFSGLSVRRYTSVDYVIDPYIS